MLVAVSSGMTRAQTGCVRVALQTRIYTSLISGSNYRSNIYSNTSAGCQYALTANTCTVSGISGTAYKGQVGVIICSLDDYNWIFAIFLTVLGYLFISEGQIEEIKKAVLVKV